MSEREVSRAVIGAFVRGAATRCRYCECEGESCKQWTGEPCDLIVENYIARCNGITCEIRHANEEREKKRRKSRRGAKRRWA